jgi:hypothetical protein
VITIKVTYGKRLQEATATMKCEMTDVQSIRFGDLSYRDSMGFGTSVIGLVVNAKKIHATRFRYEGENKTRKVYDFDDATAGIIGEGTLITVYSDLAKHESWNIKDHMTLQAVGRQLETLVAIEKA